MERNIDNGMESLPNTVLQRAQVYGKEYAWSLLDIESTVNIAVSLGLAVLGGEARYHFPDNRVYDMYWRCYGSNGREPDEDWQTYVKRSADETIISFRELISASDFSKDAQEISYIFNKYGVSIDDAQKYLYFVLSVINEAEYLSFLRRRVDRDC